MIRTPLFIALTLSAGLAAADNRYGHSEYAKVTQVTPVYAEVRHSLPREHCWEETVSYRRHNPAAPILGALIGAAIGHELGDGRSHQRVGTFVGAAVGASVAAGAAEGHGHSSYRVEHHCNTVEEVHWRQEVVGYDVTYRYHGKHYQTRMPYDPGDRIRVAVDVRPID